MGIVLALIVLALLVPSPAAGEKPVAKPPDGKPPATIGPEAQVQWTRYRLSTSDERTNEAHVVSLFRIASVDGRYVQDGYDGTCIIFLADTDPAAAAARLGALTTVTALEPAPY